MLLHYKDLVYLVHTSRTSCTVLVHPSLPSVCTPATTYGNVLAKSMHETSQGLAEKDMICHKLGL